MTIRIDSLKKISAVLNSKDSGCYGYIAGPNFVFVGSKDAFSGKSLLNSINFSEAEVTKLENLGLQYIGHDETWIMSVFNLGKDRSIERNLTGEPEKKPENKKEESNVIEIKAS